MLPNTLRRTFSRDVKRIRRFAQAGKPYDRILGRLRQRLEPIIQRLQTRQASVPDLKFPSDLPVVEHLTGLQETIRQNQVVIVSGETGSGKSTQLPKICLSIGRGIHGAIGHTQPRRLAARSIAARVAEELEDKVGGLVGFKIRFTDTTADHTLIKLMTDGILLAETQADRDLLQYDTLIIDEAHERSLNIDFLLGYLKRLLPRRPDLKLIITSATIDAERFAAHFETNGQPAPVVEVTGRAYPVDIVYRPLAEDQEETEPDWHRAVVDAIDEVARIDHGHALVFLPTERDIHELMKLLRGHPFPGDTASQKTEVLPLYARLTAAEQNRVFRPRNYRRIVLTTNVAESSLTVPGIRFVIDTGTARISRYSARSRMQRLPIEAVSRASADQRAGRCGRVGPGIAVRLFSEDDYEGRPQFTSPEIQRTNLASVILQTLNLDLGAIEAFPFLDPPRPTTIRAGYQTLFELGAIDESNRLTDIGRKLHRLPVDPRIGRMILAADTEGCLHDVLIIAAVLEIRDPRHRPLEKQSQADQAHQKFQDESSDFISFLKLWDWFHDRKQELSRNQLRRRCEREFLSWNRMREWTDIFRQLRQLAESSGLKLRARCNDPESIHRALLSGLLSSVANWHEGHEYAVAGGTKASIWPGSSLAKKKSRWIMAGELIETNRRYLRTVARIQPQWIEPLATHLVKRHYSDPFWSSERGSAVASERVTLFGLTIVSARQVAYQRIDRGISRELFIQHALVDQDWDHNEPFLEHNRNLKQKLEQLGAKARRFDLVEETEAVFEFYNARLPADVFDARSFKRWYRRLPEAERQTLMMTQADLLRDATEELADDKFPDVAQIDRSTFELEYHLEPGSADDGVTIKVPAAAVQQFDRQRLGWLVPGLLEEKVTALIRSLPKDIRRSLVPAPDTARAVVAELEFGRGDFDRSVAAALSRIAGEPIQPTQFDHDRLPNHLRMNIKVIDDDGAAVGAGRDLEQLQSELVEHSPGESVWEDPEWTRDDLTTWDLGDLPDEIEKQRGGVTCRVFPALCDHGSSVGLRLFESRPFARHTMRYGLRRLFALESHRKLKTQVDWLPQLDRIQLLASTLKPLEPLRDQLLLLLADRSCLSDQTIPKSEAEYAAWLKRGQNRISVAVQDVSRVALAIFEAYHQIRLALDDGRFKVWKETRQQIEQHLKQLLSSNFLTVTPWPWLIHFPRYLEAMRVRLERIDRQSLARDQQHEREIGERYEWYLERREQDQQRRVYDNELEHYRWMLEEFRVSVFAQALKTAVKVSPERLQRQQDKLLR